MGYKNCCSVGYEVQHCLDCGTYNVSSHGDIGAFYNSISNADLPSYTTRFYFPTQHESLSNLKYDKLELGYDPDMHAMRDHAQGAPIEAYIPRALMLPDSGSASPSILVRDAQIMPKRTIVDEILRAQAEILGKQSSPVFVRATEIKQEIHLMRTIRRLEIFKKKEESN